MERFERVEPNGWSLNMFAIPLRDGGTLVHSPTWLGEATFARVEAVGGPRILFAPNHFHHRSLARFRARYPDAIAVATEGAQRRLRAKGHRDLQDPAQVESLLPDGAHFLRCAGLRSGEAWLSVVDGGARTLVVSDAFFHVLRPVTGIAGFGLRRLSTLPGLCIGDTFRWLAVADRAAYRDWAKDTIQRVVPTRLALSHGEILEAPDLSQRLIALIAARLG